MTIQRDAVVIDHWIFIRLAADSETFLQQQQQLEADDRTPHV